ncbi:hypothetical protein COCON_G00035010 [Conger conger]|uniref:Uncharacterized protein n=1 Tax=Conger conger TaxID=82655 RepID=A0A9Q1DZC8_CONCO|nr:hypothetical protein COCON_G00035010 [Conger conger]
MTERSSQGHLGCQNATFSLIQAYISAPLLPLAFSLFLFLSASLSLSIYLSHRPCGSTFNGTLYRRHNMRERERGRERDI